MYTLDTNVVIYYLKDEIKTVNFLKDIFSQNIPVYVSAITEVELFSFPKLGVNEANYIEDILQTLTIMPLDSRIARIAGYLRRNFKLQVPDSIIAATALITGTTLLTRNTRDFRKIPRLSLQKI